MENLKTDQLKIPSFRDREKKEWIKPDRAQETFRTHLAYQCMYSEEREKGTQRIFEETMVPNSPNLI